MAGSNLKGLNQVLRNLNKAIDDLGGATLDGLEDIGLDLVGRAARDAPVDTGDLRGSARSSSEAGVFAKADDNGNVHQTGSIPSGTKPVIAVAFGTPYAVRQHEELEYKHPRGGKAKYLEDNVKKQASRYVRLIADRLKRQLRG